MLITQPISFVSEDGKTLIESLNISENVFKPLKRNPKKGKKVQQFTSTFLVKLDLENQLSFIKWQGFSYKDSDILQVST
jgi:hypothetical protein